MSESFPVWKVVSACPHCGAPLWCNAAEQLPELPPDPYYTCNCIDEIKAVWRSHSDDSDKWGLFGREDLN